MRFRFPEDVEGVLRRDAVFKPGQQEKPRYVVVDPTDNRTSETRGEDIFLDPHEDLCLSPGLFGLEGMHVHLVPVKVSVVRGTDGRVEPEGFIREHLDRMSHDTHLVQGRLPVEKHDVPIF